MKNKILLSALLALMMAAALTAQGQDIRLTFTAADNDLPVQLDYVTVYNLTQDVGPLVVVPGTTLTLAKSAAVPLSGESFSIQMEGNNPIDEVSRFSVFTPEDDRLLVSVSNMLGQEKVLFHDFLPAGLHSFRIAPGQERFLVIIARWRSSSASLKVINGTARQAGTPSITYLGASPLLSKANATSSAVILPFEPGDLLSMEGFRNGTSYYLETYPTESQNITLPKVIKPPVITGCPGTPTVTYAGKTYNTVQIGTQCWMKENLDVGVMVTSVYIANVSHQETSNNGIIEKYCYNNDPGKCAVYGGLYNWCEVVQYYNGATDSTLWNPPPAGNVQGICPAGWHIPSEAEWQTVTNYLGDTLTAGGKMKEKGYIHWNKPNTGATNSSGFTSLPAGSRSAYGNFSYLSQVTFIWSSTPVYSTDYLNLPQPALIFPRNRIMQYANAHLKINGSTSTFGMSVRCLKD